MNKVKTIRAVKGQNAITIITRRGVKKRATSLVMTEWNEWTIKKKRNAKNWKRKVK